MSRPGRPSPLVTRDGPPPARHRVGGLAGGLLSRPEALQAEHQEYLKTLTKEGWASISSRDDRERPVVRRPSLARLAGHPEDVAGLEMAVRQLNLQGVNGGVGIGKPLLNHWPHLQ